MGTSLPAPEQKYPIVGIGASAGGLEALQGLLSAMPADTGMSFALVTHLARGHASSLVEILSRYTQMPVKTAADGAVLNPNELYVCPPDHIMTVGDGRLRLQLRVDEAQRKPIDVFLSSLAEHHNEATVGILLSGGGSDGTLGIKAIKEHGGLTLAQGGDGTGPLQTGMPDTAIAAGVVDLVLPVEEMARRLAQYARNFPKLQEQIEQDYQEAAENESKRNGYQAIYRLLQKQVGHDFSGYKEKSVQRRVRHRMQVLQIASLKHYIARLRDNPEEVTALFRDLLIGVTNFFRDPGAFETLEKNVIPAMFEGKGASDTVRVWVPGCATGEEVYSLAILLREHMDTLSEPPKVQVFATDIDESALVVARTGRYPEPLLENVSKARLKRFFAGDDVSYAVNKDLRDMCLFSAHSVIKDPPFSRIDMISCRNLLIYLGSDSQARVIPVFHFALRPGGYLFLGTAENVRQFSDLFAPVDKKQRIFQRRDHVTSPLHFPAFIPAGRQTPSAADMRRSPAIMASNLRHAVETRVLERFAPAHVVVNQEGDILYYSARTGKYLEPTPGLPNRQLVAMARRGLRLDLRIALREAVQTRRQAVREHVSVELEDRVQHVDLIVDPLGGDNDRDPLFLVMFRDVGPPAAEGGLPPHDDNIRDRSTEYFEQELRETRERLQATIEEYESAVEELKSSNEELQSMNEELQSTNEELETSKEELQSVNEELQTVNSELNTKVEEVDRANSDLRNVFESTQVATIFLDHNLVIRSFTPAVAGIFNLISSDHGRPLTDIVSHLKDTGDLKRDIQSVLEHGDPIERRVRRNDGAAHYLMRILPYRGRNNLIDGVLVTFVNVTTIVKAEEQQRTMVEELNHRVRNMLTVVGAIANQTMAKTDSPKHFAEAFLGRLQAMGKSYALVSRESWGEVSLRDILMDELQSYAEDRQDRICLEGPDLAFPPSQALALGLVLHELTTNAIRHGALAKAKGRVSVAWKVEKDRLLITWQERDGGKIAKPKRHGFGTELIQRELKSTLGAKVTFDYAPKGLEVHISIPYEAKYVAALRAASKN
jgi:two-component system, chemotaxis family, CheB/CheR fusion protein